MADAKITQLNADASPTTDDLIVTVNDAGGTPANKKVTLDNVGIMEAAATRTLANKTLTAPKFADLGFIADANGNELIILDTVASAVNEVTLANAATGGEPTFTATGGDSNINLGFQTKGAGSYRFYGTNQESAQLRLYEDTDNGTNSQVIKPAAALSTDYTLTLPAADDTLVGKATTDTLTGKTYSLAGSGNVLTNPYKFGVYRNGAANSGNNAFAKVTFDVELFDSNSNFATGTYTAPVAGFYQFSWSVAFAGTTTRAIASLYKNGAEILRGSDDSVSRTNATANGSGIIQVAATDTIEVYAFANTTTALSVTDEQTFFNGFMVSHT